MKKSDKEIAVSSNTQFVESEEDIESSSSSSEEDSDIEREIADATFEELQKVRSDGSCSVYRKPKQDKKSGRANKNRPMEASCKKPVSRFREVVQAPKKVVRDPRFESLCGNLDVEGFRKRYNFLFENNLPAEREELKKQLKKSNDPKVIDQLKNRISWIVTMVFVVGTIVTARIEIEISIEMFVDIRININPTSSWSLGDDSVGKFKLLSAVVLDGSYGDIQSAEIRKQRLIKEFTKLKESGKLESFIEKRRRKNASKDHRYMPYRRPSNTEQQG
ncbi:hypothetical protein GH714_002128 [Hevea brasiliensis]|uniref:rRNA biogenesis protein RRP36 n=1 Tax=Hevea brasiliensis TaxID=3981 RepID=A0A6A6LAT6_HEVBR|nr:hypothetical protein GH714_002128 [Hevea brasiliensis]